MTNVHSFPVPSGPKPTLEQRIRHLRQANQVAIRARGQGHHPFGAILVAPDRETVLLEQGNIDILASSIDCIIFALHTDRLATGWETVMTGSCLTIAG